MKPYSKDLRIRVLAAVDSETPREEVAKTFSVSMPTIKRRSYSQGLRDVRLQDAARGLDRWWLRGGRGEQDTVDLPSDVSTLLYVKLCRSGRWRIPRT